jgi:plasmid stabilization system protein ParE
VRPYVVRPAAARDIRSAYVWYEGEREGLGEEFLAEVRATIGAVLDAPEAYPALHRQTRRALVHRFPYGLFFRMVDGFVVFVSCTHTRKNPEIWKRRR